MLNFLKLDLRHEMAVFIIWCIFYGQNELFSDSLLNAQIHNLLRTYVHKTLLLHIFLITTIKFHIEKFLNIADCSKYWGVPEPVSRNWGVRPNPPNATIALYL